MMARRRSRHCLPLAMAILVPGFPTLPVAAMAQPSPQMAERRYDIPEQPLAAALAQYATMSGIDIIYAQSVARERHTHGVRGTFTAPVALHRLLEGTGLVARFNSASAAVIEAAGVETAAGKSDRPRGAAPTLRLDLAEVRAPHMVGKRDLAAMDRYARAVQSEIYALVEREGGYHGRSYRTDIAVRVDRGGRIQTVTVLRGSGAPEWDAHVLTLLKGRQLSQQPPADLSETLRFAVETRAPASSRPR